MPEAASSREAFGALFARSRQPAYVLDARTLRFLDANAAALRFYGLSRKRFLKLSLLDVRVGADGNQARRNVLSHRFGVPWAGEVRHRARGGRLVDLRVFAFPAEIDGRRAWVSTLVPAERQSRVERQRLVPWRDLFEAHSLPLLFQRSPVPMWVFDVETLKFLAVNDAALAMYGYSRKELTRMTLADIRPAEDRRQFLRVVRRESRSDSYHAGVWRHLRKDGSLMSVDIRSLDITFAGRRARLSLLTDVTESRRLVEERAEAERQLASVVEHAPIILFRLDRRGRMRLSKGNAMRALGVDPKRAPVGRTPMELNPGNAQLAAETRRALRGESFSTLSRVRGRVFQTTYTPLRDAQGRPDGTVAVAADVTEQHGLEERLRESEERYRKLYKRTPAMMHSIDRDGRIVSVSDLWLATLGYRREEVVGRRSTDFLTAESRRLAREKILPEFYRTGVTHQAPYQMVKKNGGLIDVLLSASAERDARGRVTRSFAVITDITQRKRVQAELSRATAWFESMFESSSDGIVSTDERGRFVRVNKAFERLVGYAQKELQRRTFQDITPREFHAVGSRALARMIEGGEAAAHVKEYRRKDGSRVPVHITSFPVKDRAGAILGFAAIVADLTESRRLEKEIAETGAREQAKIGRDLHDSIGQTLTAVSLSLKALERARGSDPESARAVARAESLTRLAIQQVRDVARGLLPHELQAGDVGASLRALSAGARKMFGVPCEVIFRGDTRLRDNSTAVQLYRIAQEALNNAAKHARSQEGVRIAFDAREKTLRLVVRDSGVGIRARRSAHAPGLGIAIMRHRAESLGGSLVVRRAAGGGTEVICECPRPGARG